MMKNFKFKLNRTGGMLAGSILLAVVFVIMYISYISGASERDSMIGEIGKAQGSLPKVTAEVRSVESQIAQAQSKVSQTKLTYDKALAGFPAADNMAYGEQLYRLAETDGVLINTMNVTDPKDIKQDAITFVITDINMQVSGKTENVLTFIHDLVTRDSFQSTSISQIGMNGLDKGEASVSIAITVYGVRGG